jgi:hypothetical protein
MEHDSKVDHSDRRLDDHPIDDFHRMVGPGRFLEWRVYPMMRFYEARMPIYYGRRILWETLMVAGGVTTTLMAAFNGQQWAAIIAACMGFITAWSTFLGAEKKLARYTNTFEQVSQIILKWKQLPEIEQLMWSQIEWLVDRCEEAFEREYDTWCSTGIAKLQAELKNAGALNKDGSQGASDSANLKTPKDEKDDDKETAKAAKKDGTENA